MGGASTPAHHRLSQGSKKIERPIMDLEIAIETNSTHVEFYRA